MAGVEIPLNGGEGGAEVAPNVEDVLVVPADHTPQNGGNAQPAHHAPENGGDAHAMIVELGFNIDEALKGPPLRKSQVGPFFIFF